MGNGKIRALELSMDNLLKELENSDISIKELKDFSDYCRNYSIELKEFIYGKVNK